MTDCWFVIHDLMAYRQHSDMICCKSRTVGSNWKKPFRSLFKKMEIGDPLVYYAAGSYAIVGIFKIVSHSEYFSDDVWPDVFARKIKPHLMPPRGSYLDMKKLLFKSNYQFDMFPEKEKWSMPLWGKTVKKLSKSDYGIFVKNIDVKKFLVTQNKVKIPVTFWQKSVGNKRL